MGEVHVEALEGVRPERAARAALVPLGSVHEVVHEQLAVAIEQIRQIQASSWPVEAVLLVDSDPWQRPSLRGELVAEAVQLLLAGEELEARRQPLLTGADVRRGHGVRPKNATERLGRCRVSGGGNLGTESAGPQFGGDDHVARLERRGGDVVGQGLRLPRGGGEVPRVGGGVQQVDARQRPPGHRPCAAVDDPVEYPGRTPTRQCARGGSTELCGGVGAEGERFGRSSGGGGAEAFDDADQMSEQIAHVPLGTRRLVVELVGPDPGDDVVSVGEGAVEGIDEVHHGSDLCKILLTHSRTTSAAVKYEEDFCMDEALRAVADPTRRAILRLVRDGELPAGEIASHFPSMSRPAVSQHLRVLTDAGLVEVRPDGNRRLYQWRREGLRDAATFVEEMWSDRLARLKAAAEREEWPQRTRTARRTTTTKEHR